MGARQLTFEFGPVRPAPWLDPSAEHARKERLLGRKLGELMGEAPTLTLTDNSRTMISARKREGVTHLRLHHMFVEADEPTLRALVLYLDGRGGAASGHLQRFIREHGDRIRARSHDTRPAHERDDTSDLPLQAVGEHHDLASMLATLNQRYFGAPVDARIGWARMSHGLGGRGRRHSIKLGSYRARNPLIRIHPVLDAAWVPGFFVEYIVYHEMLHHVVPMPLQNGRRRLHGPEFRAEERKFERYAEALAWERTNLDRLLSG